MATVFVEQVGGCILYRFEAFWGVVQLCSQRDETVSSSGVIPSMDQYKQEPGCPNKCLKLQGDLVSSCTSLGIPEEEDSIKFPLSAYSSC